jgi:hypothetical protein
MNGLKRCGLFRRRSLHGVLNGNVGVLGHGPERAGRIREYGRGDEARR